MLISRSSTSNYFFYTSFLLCNYSIYLLRYYVNTFFKKSSK
nr:MAG TPA_asm: hypothetical protein [Caudoviricetes sp.]